MWIIEKSVFVVPLTDSVSINIMLQMALDCFRATLKHFCGLKKKEKHKTYECMKNPSFSSHTLCLSRYDASEVFCLFLDNTHLWSLRTKEFSFGLFSENTHTLCVYLCLLVLCDVLRFSRAGIWRFFYFIIESWCPHVYHSVGSLGNRSVGRCFCIPQCMCFFISVL